jgi:hypothetical protein
MCGNLHSLDQRSNRPDPLVSFSQAKLFDYLQQNGHEIPDYHDHYYSFLSPDHKLACFCVATYIAIFCARSGDLLWIYSRWREANHGLPRFHPNRPLLIWQGEFATTADKGVFEILIADVSAPRNTAVVIPNSRSSKVFP